jgi:acetolactate synthase small subunit
MIKKMQTVSVEVRDILSGLSEIIRILRVNKIELMDLNILQYPMRGHNKIMVKVQSNRFDLNDVITELGTCHYVLNAGFIAEKETINYELVMFKLETRVLLLNADLQNLMNKYKVEYMDFGDGHFIVGAFGNREQISTMLGKLIPFGIIEYSRSSVGLLKDDMVLQYCD